MSEKLSTAKLKKMISVWLDTPEARECLKHHSEECDDKSYEYNTIEYHTDLFDCPEVKSFQELEQYIWDMWKDGSQWSRREKRKLKDNWEDYFSKTTYPNGAYPGCIQIKSPQDDFSDMLGETNLELTTKYFNDPVQAKKCILRTFVPDNQLADNYRLEVITTPRR